MHFAFSDKTETLRAQLLNFMDVHVYPAEATLDKELRDSDDPLSSESDIKEVLKKKAREEGLWNLFLPDEKRGAGLTNLEYAPLAEITGWSPDLAPEAINSSAPDTGNMELLVHFGTDAQKLRWLEPLLDGEIRSCFAMTEPDVASSDANNIATRIERDGGEYVINGRKWWSSGAMRSRCELLIVMGVTDPSADRHARHSMILVPRDTPGVKILRSTHVFGYSHDAAGGHSEIEFTDVRVPIENILGVEGSGFPMAQARLGPGRIHHCMRLLGQAERAFDLMCRRAQERVAFGRKIAEFGGVQDAIADSRIEIEQARLLVLKTAWLMDTVGNKGARTEIAAIKVAVPQVAANVIDRAIQVHGGAGVSEDFPLAQFYADARYLRIGDGPDAVHKMLVARRELARFSGPA